MKCQAEKFGFSFSQPERLTQSRWIQVDRVTRTYLAYKVLLATFWLAVVCITVWDNSFKHRQSGQGGKFFIYATHWGELLFAVAIIFDALLVSIRFAEEREAKKLYVKPDPSFAKNLAIVKFSWFLSTCAYTCAFFITIVFWGFLFDYSRGVSGSEPLAIFTNLSVHALQSVSAIIDIFVSSRPCRVQHAWCPAVFGLVYMIFNVVYIVAFDGTDFSGNDFVYPILKWNEDPGISSAFVVGSLIALPMLQCFQYGLTRFRDYLWSRNYFDPSSELADLPPVFTGTSMRQDKKVVVTSIRRTP